MPSPPLFFEMFADVPERAMAFYSALFAWSFARLESSGESWSISFTASLGIPAGRLLKRDGILIGNPRLQSYVNACVLHLYVPDIEATLVQAAKLGGIVRSARLKVPGLEQHSYLMDPEGNMLCVVQAERLN